MHDGKLDAHADDKVRNSTDDTLIGVRIISSVGIRLIIAISAVIPSIGIWISIVSTSIGSTINPTNVPTVGSIIVLCIILVELVWSPSSHSTVLRLWMETLSQRRQR